MLGRARYRLACSRSVSPVRVEVGKPAQVVLEIANVSSTRCGMVLAEEQVPYTLGSRPRFVLPGLEPGERRAVSYPVRSDVRGRFLVGPLSLTLTDPFGMGEHRRSFTARDQLIVIPKVVALPPVQLPGDWSGSGDSRPRAVSASGEDDVTTREYRQGDDLRRVHWRSTARRGELMVRREEQPWQSRATLLLDRRRAAHRGDGTGVQLRVGGVRHRLRRGAPGRSRVRGPAGRRHRGPGVRPTPGRTSPAAAARQTSSAVLDTLSSVSPGGGIELQRAVHAAARAATGGLRRRRPRRDRRAGHLACWPACTRRAPTASPWSRTPASAINDADLRAEVTARTLAQVEQLRAAGWDVVPARGREPLDHTWRRIGSGRTVGGVRR